MLDSFIFLQKFSKSRKFRSIYSLDKIWLKTNNVLQCYIYEVYHRVCMYDTYVKWKWWVFKNYILDCLDETLMVETFRLIKQGKVVKVPTYDFLHQRRWAYERFNFWYYRILTLHHIFKSTAINWMNECIPIHMCELQGRSYLEA